MSVFKREFWWWLLPEGQDLRVIVVISCMCQLALGSFLPSRLVISEPMLYMRMPVWHVVFVVPLETRLDALSIGEMVVCVMQLGSSYCTGHSVAIWVSTVPYSIWICCLPTAVQKCCSSCQFALFLKAVSNSGDSWATRYMVLPCMTMTYKITCASSLLGCMRGLDSQQEKASKSSALWDLAFSLFYFEPNF